ELKLVFSSDLIPDDKRVTMHKTNVSVEKAMWTLLKDTGLRFAISSKKHLVLMKREKVQEAEQNYIQETGIIIGTVFNAETGEPLPGASVYLEDTTIGAATNKEGDYKITGVEAGKYVLVAQFIGYKS